MGKYYGTTRQAPPKPRPWQVHPVWQGIGCIMMLLMPVMSYAGAKLLVDANITQRWIPMPRDLLTTITIPYLGNITHLYGNLLVAAVLMLVGYGVLVALYSLLYSFAGPPKYGPMDAPPDRRKVRRLR